MRTPVRALLFAVAAAAFATPAVSRDDKKPAEPTKWSAGPLSEARQRLLKGNYEEARAAFERLAGRGKHGKVVLEVGAH